MYIRACLHSPKGRSLSWFQVAVNAYNTVQHHVKVQPYIQKRVLKTLN